MKHFLARLLTSTLVMAVGVFCVNTAQAQFFDNFDSYSSGDVLSDPGTQNGWGGWNGSASAAGTVSNAQSLTAPNSFSIPPNIDAVNQLGTPTSGKWDFTLDMYVPTGLTGDQYYIMLNEYMEGAIGVSGTWAVQLQFDGDTGMLIDDYNVAGSPPVPIVFDTWVELRVIVDLDADTVTQFYDGGMLGDPDQPWSTRNGGTAVAIGAIDLFSDAGSTAYWDNVSMAVFVDTPSTVLPETLSVGPGILSAGGIPELEDSDNMKLAIFRDPLSINAVTLFEITGTSPTATPGSLEFTLEGNCVSRPNVVQRIQLFDYVAGAYETVDEQNANRTPQPDLSVTVAPTGDLSRFVDPATLEVKAQVRYRADIARASFASNTDQAIWEITP